MARYRGWHRFSGTSHIRYTMLRLSRNSMNVNMSTERIPAIHVSGHDMTTEAGVEGWTVHSGQTFVHVPVQRLSFYLKRNQADLHV